MKRRAASLVLAALVASPLASTAALANAANADIAAPLRAAQGANPVQADSGDQQFHQLFASWGSGERSNGLAVGTTIPGMMKRQVSIPSRMPVEGVHLTSDFGMREHPIFGGRRPHKGVDLAGPTGTPVHATADGVVGRADWFSGYGLYVQIEHGGELETRYGHLSRLNVAAGQFVHKGDVIGFIGATGNATGPHLHYEVRVDGVAVNPIPYMQGEDSARLALVTPGTTSAQGGGDADNGDD